MSATCIHPRHGEEPPLADDGLMLCRHCLGRLNRALSDIVTLWPLLDEMITPGSQRAHVRPPHTPPAACQPDRGGRLVSYLDELPRCPVCNRVLRTRNDRGWCVTCHHWVDQQDDQ